MKKVLLRLLFIFMLTIVGCQNNDTYDFLTESQPVVFSDAYPDYAMTLGWQDDQFALLTL